ncbi:MAG: hypothetical protein U0232_08775 [Thermomicrobiales bacterium]
MESLAEEVKGDGIRRGVLVPGSILTEFGGRTIEEKSRSGAKYITEDVAASILHQLRQPAHVWAQEILLWPF